MEIVLSGDRGIRVNQHGRGTNMNPIRMQIEITLDDDGVASLGGLLDQLSDRLSSRLALALERERGSIGERRLAPPCPMSLEPGPRQPPRETPDLLVDTKAAAKTLGLSTRSIYKLLASGHIPPPVRIGRSVRWDMRTMKGWIEAGCPNQADSRTRR